jgi:glycosyltransferase involved in cell wall biosynthesis
MIFKAMRILFLTAHMPLPSFSGGRIREFELIRRLGKTFEVYLCCVTKTWEMDKQYMHDLCCFCANIKLFKATPNHKELCSTYSDKMKRHASKEASYYISSLLKDRHFDVIHVEGYYMMQHLPMRAGIPVLLVEHNVECMLSFQQFEIAKTEQEKLYHCKQYLFNLKWEKIFWKRARICVTLTGEDKRSINQLDSNIDVRMISNGRDHLKMKDKLGQPMRENIVGDGKWNRVLFVGNFAYHPNIDAAFYFSQFIFPIVLNRLPNTKLFLVGNAPPPEIKSLESNRHIEVTGYVDSLVPFYHIADVVVCPLRIGGGVKVKILEALGIGKAIVSTSIGAQGLDVINYKPVIIADEATDFANKVIWLLINYKERHRQEQEAFSYARGIPTWDEVSEVYINCYKELMCSETITNNN